MQTLVHVGRSLSPGPLVKSQPHSRMHQLTTPKHHGAPPKFPGSPCVHTSLSKAFTGVMGVDSTLEASVQDVGLKAP